VNCLLEIIFLIFCGMQQLYCCVSSIILLTLDAGYGQTQGCKVGVDEECKEECDLTIGCEGIFREVPPVPECTVDSLKDESSVCLGVLELIEEPATPQPPVNIENCTEQSFVMNADTCSGELVPYDALEECDAESFIEDNNDCSGELIAFTDKCTAASFDTENIDCFGELIPIDEVELPKCDADSFDKNADDCEGELIKIDEIITPPIKQCTAQSFKTEYSDCRGALLPIGGPSVNQSTTTTTTYQPPVTPPLPKDLCSGEGSFRTVYGQRCKKNDDDDQSSCTMGSEGFSFCDTEHLWWRDDHWYDWDLCSLCSDGKGPLTTSGWECKGECHNRWENNESSAPRCEVANGGKGVPNKDYCTTCEGPGCPDEVSNPSDKRPGNQVGQIEWQVSPVE